LQSLLGATTVETKDIWLQVGGETSARPLKWQYPIGVLFDLFNYNSELPWRITLRLKDFPDELIRCSREQLQVSFIQTLKEADQLKHKGSVIYGMKAEQQSRLFDSLCNDRFDDFWSVNQQLMANKSSAPAAKGQQHAGESGSNSGRILHVPIRFYDSTRRGAASFRQTLVNPSETLLDALKKAFGPSDAEDDDELLGGGGFEAISHGIQIPLNTPAIWLARNLAYPDNFVHVVLRQP